MNRVFQQAVDSLARKYDQLMAMSPAPLSSLPRDMPQKGVYLFSEGTRHLYAGRTNSLRTRLQNHVRDSHFTATFAFLLARLQTGNVRASYKSSGSRADLLRNRRFRKAFNLARGRIRRMDIRFVEEADPVRQALLEIYVALGSNAKHNSFETH